ncbi:MAG: hypothetical protein AAGM67_07955 [Bacteroidota bacterium]
MSQAFEQRLQGGHPNSLGNTVEIVEEVLADESRFAEQFSQKKKVFIYDLEQVADDSPEYRQLWEKLQP